MVTTRSADKRDGNREEDLVLRSRVVEANPVSVLVTPTQPCKRIANTRTQQGSLRKRARLISVDVPDVVEIVSQASHSAANSRGNDDSETDNNSSSNEQTPTAVGSINKDVLSSEVPGTLEHQGLAKVSDSPTVAPKNAAYEQQRFQTPSSKHQRFASEEPDDDTIVVNQGTDSSMHNDYETADEVIEDSDEAPEIITTKIPQVRIHRRSARTTKVEMKMLGKNVCSPVVTELRQEQPSQAQAPVRAIAVDSKSRTNNLDDVLRVGYSPSNESGGDSAQAYAESKETSPFLDDPDDVKPDDTENKTSGQSDAATAPASIHSGMEIMAEDNPDLSQEPPAISKNVTPLLFTAPAMTTSTGPAPRPEGNTVLFDDEPKRVSVSQHTSSGLKSGRPLGQGENLLLPDPIRSSLSTFRGNKICQRGFKLENSWKSKRSTFVTS